MSASDLALGSSASPPRSAAFSPSELGRTLAVPLLLLVVVGIHTVSRQTHDLSPWKGGGFGMFSTIDSPAERLIRVELHTSDGDLPVRPPESFDGLVSATLAAPSSGHLEELSAGLAGQRWVRPQLDSLDAAPDDEEQRARQAAVDAMMSVRPGAFVQAIETGSFDPALHRDIGVDGVTVTVYRMDADGPDRLEPAVLRRVTIERRGSGLGGRQP